MSLSKERQEYRFAIRGWRASMALLFVLLFASIASAQTRAAVKSASSSADICFFSSTKLPGIAISIEMALLCFSSQTSLCNAERDEWASGR